MTTTLNLTAELERLIADMSANIEEFRHIDPSRLLVCVNSSRSSLMCDDTDSHIAVEMCVYVCTCTGLHIHTHALIYLSAVFQSSNDSFNSSRCSLMCDDAQVRVLRALLLALRQPFYHLFAENAETQYVAYVSEQNLLPDESGEPVRSNPQIDEMFVRGDDGAYRMRMSHRSS